MRSRARLRGYIIAKALRVSPRHGQAQAARPSSRLCEVRDYGVAGASDFCGGWAGRILVKRSELALTCWPTAASICEVISPIAPLPTRRHGRIEIDFARQLIGEYREDHRYRRHIAGELALRCRKRRPRWRDGRRYRSCSVLSTSAVARRLANLVLQSGAKSAPIRPAYGNRRKRRCGHCRRQRPGWRGPGPTLQERERACHYKSLDLQSVSTVSNGSRVRQEVARCLRICS